jgi:hypothetical protein
MPSPRRHASGVTIASGDARFSFYQFNELLSRSLNRPFRSDAGLLQDRAKFPD